MKLYNVMSLSSNPYLRKTCSGLRFAEIVEKMHHLWKYSEKKQQFAPNTFPKAQSFDEGRGVTFNKCTLLGSSKRLWLLGKHILYLWLLIVYSYIISEAVGFDLA